MVVVLQPLNLKQLLYFASLKANNNPFLIWNTRPLFIVRCFSTSSSSSSSSSSAIVDGGTLIQAGRNRRSSSSSTNSTSDRETVRASRIKKVQELRSNGLDPYAYKWDRTHTANQLQEIYRNLGNGEESKSESDFVSIAGRIVAHRDFGKLTFMTLRDDSGTIQLYYEKERLPSDQFEQLKTLVDIGDILGARGSIKRTEKGELSVCVNSFSILTKSLLPLPDKYRGLTDVDKRYRQRYVDMIANPEVAETFRKRAKIISEIRKTVESSGFVEVETPVLQGAAGGAEARPFITYHNSLGQDLYLRIATELHLKRMLVGGFEKVYEIGRIFRNEGISTRHNPEFTTIEMYEAYSDYESMMNMTEEIITQCALAVNGKLTLDYQGVEICLERPWRRETMHNLVKEAIGIEFNKFGDDLNAAKKVVLETPDIVNDNQNKNLIEACTSVGHVLNEVFEIVVEPKLMQPTFVLDYPIEISPLAKPHRRHSGLTERFELFICGREMANAFSELTDPLDQRERLEEQVRQHNNKKAAAVSEISSTEDGTERADDSYDVTLDEDFLTALEYGMPPASGMGLGIDRLVMLLTNSASIRDVIAFPVLKTLQ
ncbi:lysine--tRNA ligase, chloroplastic mitochondrial [Olea europaea subsp. europaea]|uniref:Lysine--tRNA ligase n=1 Tax=Olea europaea subsp. europaea TaxID=158383 RepID=A0A8S0UYY3_OLEEU|nr:lysine--tRNA ligase, chloroplastic mitochondrial [Olea europaea subsp. europaea]